MTQVCRKDFLKAYSSEPDQSVKNHPNIMKSEVSTCLKKKRKL